AIAFFKMHTLDVGWRGASVLTRRRMSRGTRPIFQCRSVHAARNVHSTWMQGDGPGPPPGVSINNQHHCPAERVPVGEPAIGTPKGSGRAATVNPESCASDWSLRKRA